MRVEDLRAGIYHYSPEAHRLSKTSDNDLGRRLAAAAYSQSWIEDAAAVMVIAAVYERTAQKYGERGKRYVHMEVGGVAQNVYLQAEALGLGTTAVGAFVDEELARLLEFPADTEPLLLMPLGRQ